MVIHNPGASGIKRVSSANPAAGENIEHCDLLKLSLDLIDNNVVAPSTHAYPAIRLRDQVPEIGTTAALPRRYRQHVSDRPISLRQEVLDWRKNDRVPRRCSAAS
jgi:hypothetical protein